MLPQHTSAAAAAVYYIVHVLQRTAHSSLSRLQTLLQIREDLLAVSAPLHITGHSVTHISGHTPGATSSVDVAT